MKSRIVVSFVAFGLILGCSGPVPVEDGNPLLAAYGTEFNVKAAISKSVTIKNRERFNSIQFFYYFFYPFQSHLAVFYEMFAKKFVI